MTSESKLDKLLNTILKSSIGRRKRIEKYLDILKHTEHSEVADVYHVLQYDFEMYLVGDYSNKKFMDLMEDEIGKEEVMRRLHSS